MKVNDIKKGNVVEYNNGVYQICDIECSLLQGCGGNVCFCFIMYSVLGGNKFDVSFDVDDNLFEVELLCCQFIYLYKDGDVFVFLDDEDYIFYIFDVDVIGDDVGYIIDGLSGIYVQVIDEMLVVVQLFISVVLEVIEMLLEFKGGIVIKCLKLVKFNIGIEIMVLEYIVNGECVLVNIIIGEFVGCVD